MYKPFKYTEQPENHYFPFEFKGTRERGGFDEIRAWCKGQYGVHGWVCVEVTATFHTQTFRFAFDCKDNAFAFRMRWC